MQNISHAPKSCLIASLSYRTEHAREVVFFSRKWKSVGVGDGESG